MAFTTIDKKKASAIVRVFETGKPLGDYSAVAVLNDGAGVSYGASQFTHRSGSLRAVVDEYLRLDGAVGRKVLIDRYKTLRTITAEAMQTLAADMPFRNALRAAGMTREMREAQDRIAFDKYLAPAIEACNGSGFVLPLSLAVIYDSLTHGSYEKIRDRVRVSKSDGFGRSTYQTAEAVALTFEKEWIREYVSVRHAWLGSILRLRSTRYRTQFFENQIKLGRWHLELPMIVHGVRLTDEILGIQSSPVQSSSFSLPEVQSSSFSLPVPPQTIPHEPHNDSPIPMTLKPQTGQAKACTLNSERRNAGTLARIEDHVNSAAETYDQIEGIANTIINRTDRAKSLWTAVLGTVFQTAWAVFGFLAGLPREVWFFAAGVAAALTLMYLYRQVALGKIRESSEFRL